MERSSASFLNRAPAWLRADPVMMAFSSISRAASYLVPVPLLYYFWQPADLAFWMLVTTMIGMQNLLLLGAPQILVRMLAVAAAREAAPAARSASLDDAPGTSDLQQLMRLAFGFAAALITLLLATLGTAALWGTVPQMSRPGDGWLAWAVIVAAAPMRVAIIGQLTFLNGRGEIALPRFLDGTAWATSGILAALTLLLSGSLFATALASQVPPLLAALLLRRRMRASGWDASSAGRAALIRTARQTWPPIWRAGVGALASTGTRQGVGIVLAQFVAPLVASAYLLAQNVISVVMMLSAAPLQTAIHRISKAYANGDTSQHVALAEQALARTLWTAALMCGGIAAIILPALHMLGHSDAFVSPALWAVLAFTVFVQRYAAAHLQHYSVTNHIIWHWLDGLSGAVQIGLAVLLIPLYLEWGAALAYAASILFIYAWIPTLYSVRRFRMEWPRGDIRAAGPPLLALILLLAISLALSRA